MLELTLTGLEKGQSPDSHLVEALDQLFSEAAAQYAYEVFEKRDPFAGALSGDRTADIWQVWRKAKSMVACSRPLDGYRSLKNLEKLHPTGSEVHNLADVERLALMGECLNDGNQYGSALTFCDHARNALHKFICRFNNDNVNVCNELREMVEILLAVKGFDKLSAAELIRSWSVSRGLDLTIELAQMRTDIISRIRSPEAALYVSQDLVADVSMLHEASNAAFGQDSIARFEFGLGNCKTEIDPKSAFEHFEVVVNILNVEHGLGMPAAINAANCLLRLGKYSQAEARYGSLESLFEMYGDHTGAARVWMSECIAAWKGRHDPSVRHSVVGAIKMYEDNLPKNADVMSLYTLKKYIEQAYMLLITANSYSDDHSEERQSETLSAIWALMSRDFLARLESESNLNDWETTLEKEWDPLTATKTALEHLKGIGIVHLISGIDCLIWIVYGYDKSGHFKFESNPMSEIESEPIVEFLKTLRQQFVADKTLDPVRMNDLDKELKRLGDKIGAKLSDKWINVARNMDHLFYMPNPYGSVDEFPLAGVRINGKWLCHLCTITRTPSINHLRESLSPNRTRYGNRKAIIVLGNPGAGDTNLKKAKRDSEILKTNYLEIIGFDCSINSSASATDIQNCLEGDVGVLHYVGHGIANQIDEALPLANQEYFTILDIDRITGACTPFVFLCACVAGKIRHGTGGYQTGLTSKIVERGAPAALAFTLPILESRAYEIAHQFYRQSAKHNFGRAVSMTLKVVKKSLPTYAWLSLAAYGDPMFRLCRMPTQRKLRMFGDDAVTWHSALRNYCVLRNATSKKALTKKLEDIPNCLVPTVEEWLKIAFRKPKASEEDTLNRLEKEVLNASDCSNVERLSLRAAICAERAHAAGLETLPLNIATDAQSIRKFLDNARFLTVLGHTLFDTRLNGLGCTLMGRVIAVDQNSIQNAASTYFKQGLEKLLECENESQFVKQLRRDNLRIIQHFGG